MKEYAKTKKDYFSISVKVSDNGYYALYEKGECTAEKDGYVPKFIDKSGDYIHLQIDIATGRIMNWDKITSERIREDLKDEKKDL